MAVAICWDCRLVDPYNGEGDGIGSCDCPRCEHCGGRPGRCDCDDDGDEAIEMEYADGDYGW